MRRRSLIAVVAGGFAGLALAAPAAAHPLGNFSINHHHTITLASEAVTDRVVIDRAEIPTAQAADAVDTDGDGTASQAELASHAATECRALAGDVRLTVDGSSVALAVAAATFTYVDGEAGLSTSRLECELSAPADLTAASTVTIVDRYAGDRVGWHEMVATATDVHIVGPPVPERSTTDELRAYPVDPLASPLDVRSVTLDVRPGAVTTSPADTGGEAAVESDQSGPGGFAGHVNDRFDDLIGRRDLTVGVGLLAIALALVLGASHALLPGHGKTLMAAYIAGRQGTSRDAVVVGATVTATHTGGVLALGLALTLSTSLAGERVLGWLGLVSGLTVAGLGLALLVSNLRNRRAGVTGFVHGHHHGYHFHDDHDHDHDDDDGHDHRHGHHHGHGHGHHHDHGHGHHHDHGHAHDSGRAVVGLLERPQLDQAFGRRQFTGVELEPEPQQGPARRVSRRGLVAMGVAGGLVPSPSALVILLSAIALGRTWFGVLLVIGYGLGMAATLTAAGLLLVLVRDRFGTRLRRSGGRLRHVASVWSRCTPYATAALVIVVGAGLALRSLSLV